MLTPPAVTMEKVKSPSAGSSSATGRLTVCTAPSSRTLAGVGESATWTVTP